MASSSSLRNMPSVTRKHLLDSDDDFPTNKRPKRSPISEVTSMAFGMLERIQEMEQTVERVFSKNIMDVDVILDRWYDACTMAKNPEARWTTSEKLALLNARLPEGAYLHHAYNSMYEAFSKMAEHPVEALYLEADRVLDQIPQMRDRITSEYNMKRRKCIETVGKWKAACKRASSSMHGVLPLLQERLPNDHFGYDEYNEMCQLFTDLVSMHVNSLCSPSDFGNGLWPEEQQKEARIYCLRPPHVRSLPLHILHHVFRQYLLDIQKPLPLRSDTAIAAQRIAAQLCAKAGRSVSRDNNSNMAQRSRDDEGNGRTKEFDECISNFLGQVEKMYNLNPASDAHSGVVDGAYLMDDILVALREMKAEPGANGDAYMQMARCYDLAVKLIQENPSANDFVRQGAPMFLLCVIGPKINVSGGFYDGKKVIVEPLTDFVNMLEDPTKARQYKVAQILYALRKGMDQLKILVQNKQSMQRFPPSTPRIYSSCTLYTQNYPPTSTTIPGSLQRHLEFEGQGCLEFERMVMSDILLQRDSLLFIGTLSGTGPLSPTQVVVKLAGRYGEDVHQLLAGKNLAPKLYAKSEVEGAPTAYVMEYLEPSSWQTLITCANCASKDGRSDFKEHVRLSVKKVLEILEEDNKVHGDLRSANIMVQVCQETGKLVTVDDEGSQRASIRVIDFDWSGKAGEVCYPATRNEEICGITWPGKPGYPIERNYDEQLVNSWWPNLGREGEG